MKYSAVTLIFFVGFFCLSLCSCATEPSENMGSRPLVMISGSQERPPSLQGLAQNLRMNGGIVVRASFVRMISVEVQRSDAQYPAGSGNVIAQDYGVGEFSVTDSLGESVPSTLTILAPIGPERLVDANDNILPAIFSGSTTEWPDQLHLPLSGDYVFFLGPAQSGGRRRMGWRSRVQDGVVDGVQTFSGESVALTVLTRQ